MITKYVSSFFILSLPLIHVGSHTVYTPEAAIYYGYTPEHLEYLRILGDGGERETQWFRQTHICSSLCGDLDLVPLSLPPALPYRQKDVIIRNGIVQEMEDEEQGVSNPQFSDGTMAIINNFIDTENGGLTQM